MTAMRKGLKWLDVNFEPLLAIILFFVMVILVAGQVILRFVFQAGFSWAEELARYLFVWVIYFCISYASRNSRHIKLSVVLNLFPDTGKKVLMLISDIMFLVFSLALFLFCWSLTRSTSYYGDMALTIPVSMNILYGSGLIGFLLNSIRLVQNIVWKILHFSDSITIFHRYKSTEEETLLFGKLKPLAAMGQEKEE